MLSWCCLDAVIVFTQLVLMWGFQSHGGYDVQMVGWGGENLDQSLRRETEYETNWYKLVPLLKNGGGKLQKWQLCWAMVWTGLGFVVARSWWPRTVPVWRCVTAWMLIQIEKSNSNFSRSECRIVRKVIEWILFELCICDPLRVLKSRRCPQDSFVAHMWRKPDDPRTRAKYTLKAGKGWVLWGKDVANSVEGTGPNNSKYFFAVCESVISWTHKETI